jgi:hypothetical protein
LVAEFNEKLKVILQKQIIQNDIIESINSVMLTEMKACIQATAFIAVLLDETSGVTDCSHFQRGAQICSQ